MALDPRPLAPGWGAEVHGLDLSQEPDGETAAALRTIFLKHSLLVFPQQEITPAQHIALSRVFGSLDRHATLPHLQHPAHAEIIIVSNRDAAGIPSPTRVVGQQWHSDLSCTPRPAMASLLHARVLPESGGDTLFANMHLAFDRLSAPMQGFLSGLTAIHDIAHARHQRDRTAEAVAALKQMNPAIAQPVVRIHPETGRPALYVNEMLTTRIREIAEEESDALLALLFRHSTRPEFVYRHRWRRGDIVMWDNRSLMHLAVAGYQGLREMHRTTVEGLPSGEIVDRDRPMPPAPATPTPATGLMM